MELYGIIIVKELLLYYKNLYGYNIKSLSIELKSGSTTKMLNIKFDKLDEHLYSIIDGYNQTYRHLIREKILSLKGGFYSFSNELEEGINNFEAFSLRDVFYSIEYNSKSADIKPIECAYLNSVPYVSNSFVTKIVSCNLEFSYYGDYYRMTAKSNGNNFKITVNNDFVKSKLDMNSHFSIVSDEHSRVVSSMLKEINSLLGELYFTIKGSKIDLHNFLDRYNKLKSTKYHYFTNLRCLSITPQNSIVSPNLETDTNWILETYDSASI